MHPHFFSLFLAMDWVGRVCAEVTYKIIDARWHVIVRSSEHDACYSSKFQMFCGHTARKLSGHLIFCDTLCLSFLLQVCNSFSWLSCFLFYFILFFKQLSSNRRRNMWRITERYMAIKNKWLTGILTSSFSNPSLPVILILNFRDQIAENESLKPSAPLYTSGVMTSTMGSWELWSFGSAFLAVPWRLYKLLAAENNQCIRTKNQKMLTSIWYSKNWRYLYELALFVQAIKYRPIVVTSKELKVHKFRCLG